MAWHKIGELKSRSELTLHDALSIRPCETSECSRTEALAVSAFKHAKYDVASWLHDLLTAFPVDAILAAIHFQKGLALKVKKGLPVGQDHFHHHTITRVTASVTRFELEKGDRSRD